MMYPTYPMYPSQKTTDYLGWAKLILGVLVIGWVVYEINSFTSDSNSCEGIAGKLIGAVVPKALNPLAMLNDVTGCGSGSDSAAQNQNIVDSCTKLSLGMGLGCAKSAVSTAKDAIGDVFGSIGL